MPDRVRLRLAPLVALAALGCLRVPPPPPDAAPPTEDAAPAASPLAIRSLTVSDARGAIWPRDAAPRRPTLVIELSAPPTDLAPVLLVEGPADDALLDDLRATPLRASTEARLVPVARHVEGGSVRLTPRRQLDPGAQVTVAIAAWARSAGGPALGAPWASAVTVSAEPDAGARALASWPPDGAARVPATVGALTVRFDGTVQGALRVEASGAPVAGATRAVSCGELGWATGACLAFAPDGPLAAGAEHALRLDAELVDATGAAVDPWEARFRVASAPDLEPPASSPAACALDAIAVEGVGCLERDDRRIRVRVAASEPVLARLEGAGVVAQALAPRGEATLTIEGLGPARAFEARLRMTDLAGLSTERRVEVSTTAPLPTLAITEVRADPAGREPAQELVEVLNFGAVPVDLAGIAISDRADLLGDVVTRSAALAPGERALLVADDFDPESADDGPVPPGVRLIRVGRSLAGGGLANAGEPLYLRDGDGHRLSAAPPLAAPEGACLVRVAEDRPRTDAPDAFAVGPCTPGRAP